MNRLHASLLVLALWAAIFLPGLGSTEIKGEEGRRILPAATMLDTGDWLVPQVGGKPFLRKPPLVNWAIAAAFKTTGARNEWTARLPSAMSLLALALCIVALSSGRGWMNAETGLVAAIFTLTQVAAIEKGRLAEIEAIYVALSGIATACWLAWWTQRRSPWLVWTVPFVFLGLGLLAKAPLHLLFFYAVAIAVLWSAGEMRALRHPAHGVGVALMLAIFAAWAVPYFHTEAAMRAGKVWQAQFAGRVTGHFDWVGWATNIPRGLSNQLPWLLFAPLLWRRDLPALGGREAALVRGGRLAVAACFFGLLLVPGVLPRYTLPLLAPFALLLAFVVADPRLAPPAAALRAWWRTNAALALTLVVAACAAPVALAIFTPREQLLSGETFADFAPVLTWPLLASAGAVMLALFVFVGRWKLARPELIATSTGALIAATMFLFAATGIPFINRAATLRPMARAIDALVAPTPRLVLYDPEYQPVLFYLRTPCLYADGTGDIPRDAPWVLAREEKRKKLLHDRPELEVVREFPTGGKPELLLLRRKE